MKANLFFLLVVLFIIPKTDLIAQNIFLMSGDINILKDEKTINLEFSYNSMAVIGYRNWSLVVEYKTEADYIQRKVKEHNDARSGKGKQWLAEWNRNKVVLFEPAFEKYMNKRLKKYGVEGGKNQPKALYTILVKTLLIDTGFPGWGNFFNPAKINLDIIIFKTQNKSEIAARIHMDDISGEGGSSDYSSTSGERIAYAYGKAGYLIGNFLKKKVYK